MSHTRGNQCHLVTWIKTITLRWSCTQYSMNMHLQQLSWAHAHTTRLRVLMTREGRSHSHENPSYKVHNHPRTHRQIYVYIYIYIYIYTYTCIMHNANTWSRKVNQTLPTFQGFGSTRYIKCITNIAIPRERSPSKGLENKRGTWMGALVPTKIHGTWI